MIYGYARVSSPGQALDGTSLQTQVAELRAAGAESIYTDVYTGTKLHRPELDLLLSEIQSGDTLVVAKLDRVARSAKAGLELFEMLAERGVSVNVLNMGVFDNTPSGKLMRTIMLAFAEFERDMIVSRTAEGRAASKAAKGDAYREGRKAAVVPDFQRHVAEVERGMPLSEKLAELGISRSTWYKLKKAG